MEEFKQNTASVANENKGKPYLMAAAKIIAFLVIMLIVSGIFSALLMVLVNLSPVFGGWVLFHYLQETAMLIGTCVSAYVILCHWEKLPFISLGLSIKGRGKDIFWGGMVAFALYAIGFGILWMLGEIRVIRVGFDLGGLVLSWGLMLLVAITEEICVRGFVLGRLLNSGMNKYLALFLSAFLFSILHLFNPNFSMLPFINILLAGLLLGFMYIYTRNLWFPISLHLFWNWLQGPVLGFEVSGADFDKTLLTLNLPTKSILNGGDFGFEGSIICTVLIAILIGVLWFTQHRRKG